MPKSGLGLEMLQNSKLLMTSGLSTTTGDAQVEHSSRFLEKSVNSKHKFFLVLISAIFAAYHRHVLSQIKKHHPQDARVTPKCEQPKFSLISPFRRDRRFDFHYLLGFCKSLVNVGSTHPSSLLKEGNYSYFPGVPACWVFSGAPGSEDLCDYSWVEASIRIQQ